MIILVGKFCWILVAQTLPCCVFCRCLISLLFDMNRFEDDISRASCRSHTIECNTSVTLLCSPFFRLKLYNQIRHSNYNKVSFLEHFICVILVCDVLCVITSVMTCRNNPGYDYLSFLRAGMSDIRRCVSLFIVKWDLHRKVSPFYHKARHAYTCLSLFTDPGHENIIKHDFESYQIWSGGPPLDAATHATECRVSLFLLSSWGSITIEREVVPLLLSFLSSPSLSSLKSWGCRCL
jgi:hypothetical protein